MGKAYGIASLFGIGPLRWNRTARMAAMVLFVAVALVASAFLYVPKAFAPELTTEPPVPAPAYDVQR